MTAPLAHTATGANPKASTTGCTHRGGRPVASTNSAPAATAARTALRVRGLTLSSSSIRVPSTSQAMSAGSVIAALYLRCAAWSPVAIFVPTGLLELMFADPLEQLGGTQLPGILRRRRTAAQPPRHPVRPFRVRILLLHPVE